MMQYSLQPNGLIFVKGYEFLSFAKNMGKDIGKNISKNLSGKYRPGMLTMRQKMFDHAKQSGADALKTSSKRIIQKTVEANSDLIGNKITNKITKVSKYPKQNNSEAVTNENDKEIPKERYISPDKRQKVIDDLRLK